MPNVILLEDDDMLGNHLSDKLVLMGHDVLRVTSVLDCLTALNENDCDLLITEFFTNPEAGSIRTSGATIVIAVRFSTAAPSGLNVDPDMPIIVIDGQAADEQPLELCRMLGASSTLRLPADDALMTQAIEEVLPQSPRAQSPRVFVA